MFDELRTDARMGIDGKVFVTDSRQDGETLPSTPTCVSGFVPRHPVFHAVYNRAVALLLITLASPILIVLTALVFVTQGRPIFYGGARLGKDGRHFDIYKFRTLDTERATKMTANKVLPRDSGLETPLGKYLRASRLDELPQLFNILRGDMNIVGPRPVREPIAALEQARNPNYAIRFNVKPGLIGPTQVYMSHGTSKRLRARYNYKLCTQPVNYLYEVRLFLAVGIAVLTKSLRLIGQKLKKADRSTHTAQAWQLSFACASGLRLGIERFSNMQATLQNRTYEGDGKVLIRTRHGLRRASVRLVPSKDLEDGFTHRVEPKNEFARHFFDRYLLDDPVIAPRAPAIRKHRVAKDAKGKTVELRRTVG